MNTTAILCGDVSKASALGFITRCTRMDGFQEIHANADNETIKLTIAAAAVCSGDREFGITAVPFGNRGQGAGDAEKTVIYEKICGLREGINGSKRNGTTI